MHHNTTSTNMLQNNTNKLTKYKHAVCTPLYASSDYNQLNQSIKSDQFIQICSIFIAEGCLASKPQQNVLLFFFNHKPSFVFCGPDGTDPGEENIIGLEFVKYYILNSESTIKLMTSSAYLIFSNLLCFFS